MKSTEFLTEAESNLALKKLDRYLDMLSDDNLRGLIPLVKKSLTTNESNDRLIQYNIQRMKAKNAASKPATTSPASSEESKVVQTISNLSEEEKKELLSLLQKEAKTRPTEKKPSSNQSSKIQSSQKQTKKDKKGSGVLTGCLLPLVGIVGIMAAIGANVDPATNVPPPEQSTQSSKDFSLLTALSGEYLDRAKQRFCQIKRGWTKSDVLNYMEAEDVDFNDMFLKKELLTPDTEIWRYGAANQIGTLYIDRDSNKVTSVIFGEISPDDCY